MHGTKRASFCGLLFAALLLFAPSVARAREAEDVELRALLQRWLENNTAPPTACEKDCFVLSTLTIGGAVGQPLSFRLSGATLVDGPTKVPLFGPPGDVRLDDLALGGETPTIGFESDHYYLLVKGTRAFTLTGKVRLGEDEVLTVFGPLVSLDANLSRGRIVEGNQQSGLSGAQLHFDPMTPESQSEAESKTPKVFHLWRAVRIGKDRAFTYRLLMSQGTELGTVRLPLTYGEKVGEVTGSRGWTSAGSVLVLPTTGKEADITVTGTLGEAPKDKPWSFSPEERSAYEWWLVESDPEFSVEIAGDAKLVDNAKSPIPPTLPTARTFLVQRGQRLEVTATSLARGEVLAAVARMSSRFVSVTARGEVISDETIAYDNNGLDHLKLTPAGQPMYLSTDGEAGRILHLSNGSPEMLVPLVLGEHRMRVQSLSETRLWPLLGLLTIPMSDYPLTTSAAQVTIGLPEDVHPVALLGGDRTRWALGRGDLLAALFGAATACFAFRTRRTRIVGSLVTVGLFFVSPTAFFLATALLFLAGAVFLASRFLRGNPLLAASVVALVLAMFGVRGALSGTGAGEAPDGAWQSLFVPEPPPAAARDVAPRRGHRRLDRHAGGDHAHLIVDADL